MIRKRAVITVIASFALTACDPKEPGDDTTPPGFPTGLSAARNGDSIEIAWTMPSDADLGGSLVLRRADEEPDAEPTTGQSYLVGDVIGFATVIYRGHPSSNTFIDTPPSPGRYCYRVFAFDTSFNYSGSASRCVDFTEEDTTPPDFDGLASATGISNTQIELLWEAATDDQSDQAEIVYDVYQAEAETGINYASPTYTTGGGATSLTVFGLSPGTTYYFVVRARDLAGNRDNNQLVRSGTTLSNADTTPPTFAGLASATGASASRIDLAWSAASDDTTAPGDIVYDIYQASASGGQSYGTPNYTTAPGATSFPVTGLGPATTYYFVVRARDQAGNQDNNVVERSASTSDTADVTPPTFAGLATADAVTETGILLTWADATDAVTSPADMVYLVYQATTSGGQSFGTPTYTTSPGATSFLVTSLSPATSYYFVVRAMDQAGNSDTNTVQRSATTLSGPDSVPPNFTGVITATAASSSAIDLTWNAAVDNVTPAAGIVYDIYFSTSAGGQSFAVPNASTPPGEISYRVTGLTASTTYYFVVRARDASGNRDANLIERS
ncbi:MAG: fibronectin type III domain-containing protein, partial [Polyangia bacterium]|nr:fibronectin type III domain-containing protein [Polyangia bacterium]